MTDKSSQLIVRHNTILPTPIVTHDIVEIELPTTFRWMGRSDNIINSGGIKISPESIEYILSQIILLPFIISSIPDDKLGQKIILIHASSLTAKEIARYIDQSELTPRQKPKAIYYTDTWHTTPNGKPIRQLIRQSIDGLLNV